jgi:hypothetical protein
MHDFRFPPHEDVMIDKKILYHGVRYGAMLRPRDEVILTGYAVSACPRPRFS